MKRWAVATCMVLVAGLAGCGSADDDSPTKDTTTGDGSAAPAVAEERSDDDWWKSSICSRLDLDSLTDAIGYAKLERQLGNGFDIDVPPVRKCVVGDAANYRNVAFGVSVLPVSAEDWKHAVSHLGATGDGSEAEPREVDAGDAAVATRSVAMALVGDRVITVDTGDADDLSADQLDAALAAAVEAADGWEPEPQQYIKECAAGDDQAAALLGTEPTARLDYYHPKFGNPVCVWATETSGVSVWGLPLARASANDPDQGYDETVDLGSGGGIYLEGDDVGVLSWANSAGDVDVTMEFVEGQPVTQDAAIALGKALEGLY